MRVISWNLDGNSRRRSTANALAYLDTLNADIVLLQEVAPLPAERNAIRHPVWSDAWGTAVLARSGLVLREAPTIPITSIERITDGQLERSHPGRGSLQTSTCPASARSL